MSSYISTATVNFTLGNGLGIYQGSEWVVPIAISERDDSSTDETPIDITGAVGRCSIKREANFDIPLLIPAVVITDPKNGKLELHLTNEDTQISEIVGDNAQDVTVLQYDVYLDFPNGVTNRILQGYVEISPSVTKESE